MNVVVNGEPTPLPEGASVGDLLRALGLDSAPCAAELNRELVPRRARDATPLADGDRVEIVTLVGGG